MQMSTTLGASSRGPAGNVFPQTVTINGITCGLVAPSTTGHELKYALMRELVCSHKSDDQNISGSGGRPQSGSLC